MIASCGKIIDASFVEAPKQSNRRHENEQIKCGKVPARIARKPRRACQKDLNARWTKKNNQSYYGYTDLHLKIYDFPNAKPLKIYDPQTEIREEPIFRPPLYFAGNKARTS